MHKKDPARNHRIHSEIVVDAYDEGEVNMSWYYYLEENLRMPFKAYIKTEFRNGNRGTVLTEVVKIKSDPEEELLLGGFFSHSTAMSKFKISDIDKILEAEDHLEMLNDWLYYHRKPLLTKRT
ncbi:MAG: calcium-binding protein [Bacteroidota bacterium]